MLEGVIENLLASILGAAFLAVATIVLNEYFYFGFYSPKKKGTSTGKKKRLGLYRKLPWRHAYKYAKETSVLLKTSADVSQLYDPTIIIGIGRGGAIYSSFVSYYMKEVPLLAIDRKYYYSDQDHTRTEDWYYPINVPQELLTRVLLVAGEYHSGKTMNRISNRLKEIGAKEIRSCVFYYQTNVKNQVGAPYYYGLKGTKDYLMPWQEASFLRTWKEVDDAKVRNYALKDIALDSLKEGFFLMRHAQTDANKDDVFIGSRSADADINSSGRLDAMNVGRFLKETVTSIDIVFCSPLKRCLQTAELVMDSVGGELVTDDRLIEMDYGDWDGVERGKIDTDDYYNYLRNQKYRIPGSSDTYEILRSRAQSFLEDIINGQVGEVSTFGKRILVVTHKTIGRIMVQAIEKKSSMHFRSIPMENASLRKIVIDNKETSVAYYIKVLESD